MLDEKALKYLHELSLKSAEQFSVDGQKFSATDLHRVRKDVAQALQLSTLSGLVEYIKKQNDTTDPLVLHVESPTRVCLYSVANEDRRRDTWLVSNAIIPTFTFGTYLELEPFLVALRSGFAPTDSLGQVLGVLGTVTEQNVTDQRDEGLSQSVTTKKSIQTGTHEQVPSRVPLNPFRTFIEVEQPSSEFILRLKTQEGYDDKPVMHAMLVEADGGAWRIAAMESIKSYLRDKLQEQIGSYSVLLIG